MEMDEKSKVTDNFFSQLSIIQRKSQSNSNQLNDSRASSSLTVSSANSSTKETVSIYGGVANDTMSIAHTSSVAPALDVKTNRWSSSLQTVLDQPSATFPQRLIMGGIAFCVAFVIWGWFGQIEEVGKAQGKLVPKGDTYKVEPIELGKVSHIAVKEGELVKAGQVLIELDTEIAEKEVERMEQMVAAYQIELAQKQSLLEGVRLAAQTQVKISAAETIAQQSAIAWSQEKAALARRMLAQQQTEMAAYRARQAQLQPLPVLTQERLEQLHSELKAHQNRLERLIPLEQEGAVSQEFIFQAEQARRQSQQQLTQSQLQEITNSREQLFQAEQSQRELQARITQTQGELYSATKEAERLQAELSQKQAERHRIELEAQQKIQQLEVEITQIKGKIAETKNLLVTAQAKLKYKFLKSPIDGIVLSLDLKNTGKVVQTGQTLVEIAPQEEPLVLSAILPNQEAGFIAKGMSAQVKFDAYPYQDYGVITGKIASVSADAETDERLGEVYRVEVELERDHVTENQQPIKLKAGQTASADIIIRRRRIMDVLLDPIRKLRQDGIDL